MQTKNPDTHDCELEQELVGILNAISIVSKRLAKRLTALQKQDEPTEEGGEPDDTGQSIIAGE